MIKIKKEDSIVDILKKIDKVESEDIILDFPFSHSVLHNNLSLKIIQTKTRNKKLSIISNDETAKKIAKVLGIKFIKNKKIKNTDNFSTKNILKENYTFLEYAKFEIKNFFGKIRRGVTGNLNTNKKINSIIYFKNKYGETNKNIIFYFLLILTLILLLLLYIYYIAISKTYITIYPEKNLKIKSRNFTFIEKKDGENYSYINNKIYINRVNKKIKLTKKIGTSGIKQNENNLSKGKVIFYNYLPKEVYLLKNTTLKNKEGVLFYLPKNITIPKSKKNEKGKIIAGEKKETIFGKIKLLNGNYSGLKTNIGTGTQLIIPKLGKNKSKIFAKSIENFKGGTNNFIKLLTQEDLDNAKKLMEDTLKQLAIQKIKKEINENNKENSLKVDLVPIDNIFKFTNLKIKIPEHLKIGDEIKDFNIYGEIEITTFTYNKQSVISVLKNSINETLISKIQKIISINDDELRISHILKRNDLKRINGKYIYNQNLNFPLLIKATTEIEYYVSNNFDKENGNLIQRIKYSIKGKDIDEAEKILTNKSEINNVEIKVQPFFMKKISELAKNIDIIVENQ